MISNYIRNIAQESANLHKVSFAVVPNTNPARRAYWQIQLIPEGEKAPSYSLAVVHPSEAHQQLGLNL